MIRLVPLLLLVVWTYLASCFVRDSYFNLFVNRIRTALFRPVTWFQRLGPRVPEAAAAGVLLALVFAASCVLPKAMGADASATFGGFLPIAAPRASLPRTAALQAGSFLVLLGQLALLRTAFALRFGPGARSEVREFLDAAVWPASRPRHPGAAAAAAAGLLLAGAWLCACAALGFRALPQGFVLLALLGAVDLLALLRGVLIALCVLSWLPLFFPGRMQAAAAMANEGLGDFTRLAFGRDFLAGPVSLGPLLLWFVLGFLHPMLVRLVAG